MIGTSRLILRRWRDADRAAFADMNADPRVMEFFLAPLTREQSDAFMDRIEAHFDQNGFGFWAVERRDTGVLAGMVGLARPSFGAHFTPCVEIGWRLMPQHWGQGIATEAARAALNFAFGPLSLREVVAFTVPANEKSR